MYWDANNYCCRSDKILREKKDRFWLQCTRVRKAHKTSFYFSTKSLTRFNVRFNQNTHMNLTSFGLVQVHMISMRAKQEKRKENHTIDEGENETTKMKPIISWNDKERNSFVSTQMRQQHRQNATWKMCSMQSYFFCLHKLTSINWSGDARVWVCLRPFDCAAVGRFVVNCCRLGLSHWRLHILFFLYLEIKWSASR